MSWAICTNCGKDYHWGAYRGSKLADNPSPCCNAIGKARGERKAPPKEICPDCGKAGLWWRKAVIDSTIPRQPMVKEGFCMVYTAANKYCPRCKKWVITIKHVTTPGYLPTLSSTKEENNEKAISQAFARMGTLR